MGIHQIGKGRLAAGDMLRKRNAGIVAGLDDHALEQILQRHPLADFDKHLGTAGAPSLLADQDLIRQGKIAFRKLAKDNIGGHDFGQAGGFEALIGIGLAEHLTAVVLDQQIPLGRQGRWIGDRKLGGLNGTHRGKGKKQDDSDLGGRLHQQVIQSESQ